VTWISDGILGPAGDGLFHLVPHSSIQVIGHKLRSLRQHELFLLGGMNQVYLLLPYCVSVSLSPLSDLHFSILAKFDGIFVCITGKTLQTKEDVECGHRWLTMVLSVLLALEDWDILPGDAADQSSIQVIGQKPRPQDGMMFFL